MIQKRSRTQEAFLNFILGSGLQLINIILVFVSRSIFLSLLNMDYLGVNGLFTNVLTLLSFAELGIGGAIVYSLYKPIADNNINKIQALMRLYQTCYRTIGIVIFIVGLLLIPFLPVIIQQQPNIKENLTVIYILFLINTSSSYFFTYRKSLISAYQKEYIATLITRIMQMVMIVVQTIVLMLTHQYMAYLVVNIGCTILTNVMISWQAKRMFPEVFVKNENILDKAERKTIISNVKSLFIYHTSSNILHGSDNIIISMLSNLTNVGLSSNYSMLIQYATMIAGQGINALLGSIGNLVAQGHKAKIKSTLHELLFVCNWVYGFISIELLVLGNGFIKLWLGSEAVLPIGVLACLIISMYINGMQFPAYSFRTTQGLFRQSQFVPLFTALLNIILSFWWGSYFGIAGVFLATGVARFFTTTLIDPILVYKKNFNALPIDYFKRYFGFGLITLVILGITTVVMGFINIDGWISLILSGILSSILVMGLYVLFTFKLKEFESIKRRILFVLHRN